MHGTCSIDINAPAEKVWEICSGEYHKVSNWMISCPHSEPIADAGSAVRTRDGSTGRKLFQPDGTTVIRAKLLEHSDQDRTFFYESEGLPFFVLQARNRWTVEEVSDTSCRFHLELTGKLNTLPGVLLDPIMTAWVVRGSLKGICESLKHYAETGEPTEAKKRELERWQQRTEKK